MTRSALPATILAVIPVSVAALAWPALGRAEPVAEATSPPEATAPVAAARASRVPAEQPAAHRRRFYVDFGGALVKPVSSSRELELADVEGPASLAVQNGPIKGSGATVGSALIPAGSIGWVLPWWKSRRVSAELVFGLPFKVTFEATGTLANMSIAPTALGIPTGVPALGPRLGEAMATPVVVTTVYQLIDHGVFRPYLGAGASVLFASQAKVTNPTLTEVSRPEMSISPAPGLVLQGGLEARLSDRIFARLDVKFIALMLARAQVHHIEVNTPDLPLFGNVEVGTAKMDVWVNPLIVHAGVGFDFDL